MGDVGGKDAGDRRRNREAPTTEGETSLQRRRADILNLLTRDEWNAAFFLSLEQTRRLPVAIGLTDQVSMGMKRLMLEGYHFKRLRQTPQGWFTPRPGAVPTGVHGSCARDAATGRFHAAGRARSTLQWLRRHLPAVDTRWLEGYAAGTAREREAFHRELDDSRRQGMDSGKNCWEYIGCGREPGGRNEAALGVCPAATDERLDGLNHGVCGGRVCWAVPRTHQLGVLEDVLRQGTKLTHCLHCPFLKTVETEEGADFDLLKGAVKRYQDPPRVPSTH